VPVICPTCQNVFAGESRRPPATLHGVVFDILIGGGGVAFPVVARPSSLPLRSCYAGHHAGLEPATRPL
jgi:hypothetical protein